MGSGSQHLMHAYYDHSVPTPPHEPAETMLEWDDSRRVHKWFRTFAMTAARSSVQLSSSAHSAEDVRAAFLSLTEGLDGLRRHLLELGSHFDDTDWLVSTCVSIILVAHRLTCFYLDLHPVCPLFYLHSRSRQRIQPEFWYPRPGLCRRGEQARRRHQLPQTKALT